MTMQALLLSAARTYMFSTALPLPLVAAAHAALDVAQQVLTARVHLRDIDTSFTPASRVQSC